jgi:hypothetical protein
MKIQLLRFFAKRPLTLVAVLGVTVVGIAIGSWSLVSGGGCHCTKKPRTSAVEPMNSPRKILSRGWYDSLPKKRTDNVNFIYFGGGGIGIYHKGSRYRHSVDVFDFERQNTKLAVKFLQDGKTTSTQFSIKACNDKPPFNLCLDLTNSPRGPKRYYGFNDRENEARYVPWVSDLLPSKVSH